MNRRWMVAVATALTLALLGLAPSSRAQVAHAPSKGDVIPAFESLGIDGTPHKMEFPDGSKTVLLFFLSGCPSCHKMIPEWNRAFERKPEDLKVVGVIMDQEPPGFWSTMPIAFPVVRAPGRQFLRNLNVNRAPLTLRVVGGGTVEDLALGVTDPIRIGELFRP